MDERGFNRADIYKFLDRLVNSNPDDAVGMLKDIIVGYWFFPNGDGSEYAELNDLEKEVSDLMNSAKKIEAIKRVREVTGLGLAEAKNFVEQRDWPTGKKNDLSDDMKKRTVAKIISKLATDFRVPLE